MNGGEQNKQLKAIKVISATKIIHLASVPQVSTANRP